MIEDITIFSFNIESSQDNAALVITGDIRGKFRENFHQELKALNLFNKDVGIENFVVYSKS